MFCLYLAFVHSRTFLTNVYIDGYPLQQFVSSKYTYFVSVPYSKMNASIKAFTNKAEKPAKLMIGNSDFTLQKTTMNLLSGFDNLKIKVGKKKEYNFNFVKVPKITEPVIVNTEKVLTPKAPTSPLINSAHVVGTLPDSVFHHYVSTSGERPITFTAVGLPNCYSLDSAKGIITGKSPSNNGEYIVKIVATNSFGADFIYLRIVVGQHQRQTPIQGWSSWYTQSQAISEDAVFKMADAALKYKISDFGFVYLNIDDCWQGPREDVFPYKFKGKKPFNKDGVQFGGFTNMKNMTDYLHSQGLKAGIYSGPKPSTYAGHLGSSSFNSSGMDYNIFSPFNGNTNPRGPIYDEDGYGTGSGGNPGVFQPSQYYGSWFGGYESSPGGKEVGPVWFGDLDVQTFADWGFDFMKWDWLLFANVTLTDQLTRTISSASVRSGRNMALSLSNNVGHNRDLMLSSKNIGATSARISGDISDNWGSVSNAAKEALFFIDLCGGGFWPDPDMLQLGYLGTPNGLNVNYHKTHLSENEQYFQVSFWAILPAPLVLSCDLAQLDDFTIGLLNNREVIMINQDEFVEPSMRLFDDSDQVIVRRMSDGTVAIGAFCYGSSATIYIKLDDITQKLEVNFPNGATLRNVWEQKDIGLVEDEFTIKLGNHQGLLFRLIPII